MARKLTAVAASLAVGLLVGGGGAAAYGKAKPARASAAKVIDKRQANMKAQGAAMKAIGDELKKDSPDNAVLASNAAKLKALAADLPSWFPKGSGPESGAKTKASADVWTDAAGFQAAANRFEVETSKLDQFAKAADWTGFKGQVRNIGGACKNCHDKFQTKEPPKA